MTREPGVKTQVVEHSKPEIVKDKIKSAALSSDWDYDESEDYVPNGINNKMKVISKGSGKDNHFSSHRSTVDSNNHQVEVPVVKPNRDESPQSKQHYEKKFIDERYAMGIMKVPMPSSFTSPTKQLFTNPEFRRPPKDEFRGEAFISFGEGSQ